jgi:hypothetical protein
MANRYSSQQINQIFPIYNTFFADPAIALTHLAHNYNIKPCSIVNSNINFIERKFWRYLEAVRKGNDGGEVVLIFFFYIFFFINTFFIIFMKG